jgi:hypothetical protein
MYMLIRFKVGERESEGERERGVREGGGERGRDILCMDFAHVHLYSTWCSWRVGRKRGEKEGGEGEGERGEGRGRGRGGRGGGEGGGEGRGSERKRGKERKGEIVPSGKDFSHHVGRAVDSTMFFHVVLGVVGHWSAF